MPQRNWAEKIAIAMQAREAGQFMRKPKVGLYELYCGLCFKLRNEVVRFDSAAKLNEHLRLHFVAAAPVKIKAIA